MENYQAQFANVFLMTDICSLPRINFMMYKFEYDDVDFVHLWTLCKAFSNPTPMWTALLHIHSWNPMNITWHDPPYSQ